MSVLNLVRNIIRPSRGKDGPGGPFRLSPEALDAIAGNNRDSRDDSGPAASAQLGGTRTCYGTRATVRAALPDSPTVPVMLREISETSLSLLIYGPIPEGEQFWMYIPVAGAPNDYVSLWCVVEECKGSGLEDEGYVARASFMDGTPPPLPVQTAPVPTKAARPTTPSRMFSPADAAEPTEPPPGLVQPRPGGSGLFLRSQDGATAAPQPQHETTSEYAPLSPQEQSQPILSEYSAPMASKPLAASLNHGIEIHETREFDTDQNKHDDGNQDSGVESDSKVPLTSRQLRNIASLIRSQVMNLNRLSQRLDRHKIPDEEALRGDLFNAREAMQQLRLSIQKRRMKAGDRIRRRRRRRMTQAQDSASKPAPATQTFAASRPADPTHVPASQPLPIQAVA